MEHKYENRRDTSRITGLAYENRMSAESNHFRTFLEQMLLI